MILLHCIVGQVNKLVIKVLHVELLRSSTDVAILIPVPFLIAVRTADANVRPNVELSLLIQEGHYVLLDDMSTRATLFVHCVCSDNSLNLLNTFHHLYSCSSVGVFARLH